MSNPVLTENGLLSSDVNDRLWDEAQESGRLIGSGTREDGAIIWTLKPAPEAPKRDEFGFPKMTAEEQLANEVKHARQQALRLAVEFGTTSNVVGAAQEFTKFLLEG